MNKKILVIFALLSFVAYSEENVTQPETASSQIIIKEVSGENMQQLDVKEIDTEELILQNQNLESSTIKISGENLKENGDKVVVKQENTVNLEEELSQGVEKKGFFRKLWDKLFN